MFYRAGSFLISPAYIIYIITCTSALCVVRPLTPGIPQHAGFIPSWDRGVYCRGGDLGDRGSFLHNFSIYGSISQKSIRLRKKAFIKECMDTYKSIVHFLVFANTSTVSMIGASLAWPLFMIEYQDKSLVYCHIHFTDNSMFQLSLHI